jgi:hypothetical protein
MTAIEKVQNLLQGFKFYLFDIDDDKSGLVSQKWSGENAQEIDCIATKDNIVLLISIYDGIQKRKVNSKFKPFFRNLRYLFGDKKIKLEINNMSTQRGKANKKKVDELMQQISQSSYQVILIKLIFCPKLYVPKDSINLRNDEAVIDKSHYKYFDYSLSNIGPAYTEREIFYFLKIKKRLIKLQKGSQAGDDPELTGSFKALETKLDESQTMYSARVAVSDIIDFVQVFRMADEYNVNAFQRMVNGDRLKHISKQYLDKYHSFPNSIILAYNPKLCGSENQISFATEDNIRFYKEFGSLIVVDGQHRLLAHLLNPTRDINKLIFINVILFLDKRKAYGEMMRLFYLINTQHKRLAAMVSLKIRTKVYPDSFEGTWYRVFESLNSIDEKDNYLRNKISFEEKEIREDGDKISINSIIKYGGLKRITDGIRKRGRTYIGLRDLGQGIITTNYTMLDFYVNFIRKYLSIIGEIIGKATVISARDLGGLLRLIFHFINDHRTKTYFRDLSIERQAIPLELKTIIIKYLKLIPFSKLSQLVYHSNEWATMEGFFVGCMRKKHRGFGIGTELSEKGEKAIVKGKDT